MNQTGQQKKGVILGPPPSSRRGASSFYSNASFVSPIIEENPYSRSHGSYASSAAMPENWNSAAENNRNKNAETFYEESMTDVSPESVDGDFGDESRLVQPVELDSAAISVLGPNQQRPADVNRLQGMGANDKRTSWNVLGTARRMSEQPSRMVEGQPGQDDIIHAYAAASSGTPTDFRMGQSASANNTRNSAMKRGLRIDMDAVREAESRGSLTSLPDLIRRATKLAAMIDKGKRPTSRMDNLSDFLGEKQLNAEGRGDTRGGRPGSGLSDMLAAFPPPVSTPQFNNGPNRSSWLGQGGWPLKSGSKGRAEKADKSSRSKRRCCGLPLWAFIVVTILLLCIIVAAIVVPLELFVFNKNTSQNDSNGIDKCREDLTCLNGGTNVVSRGTCSCICSGGFTGPDCGTAGSVGCTTTDLVSTDKTSTIKNVTLGQSIPRLVAEANANFSVPLSGTSILAKINASGLSCIAQNSLVTFNGRSSRSNSETQAIPKAKRAARQASAEWASQISNEGFGSDATLSNPRLASPETDTVIVRTRDNEKEPFNATDTVIDFCRVSVLFVLQEQGVNTAQDAQSDVQAFLTKISTANSGTGAKITQKEASNITIGNGGSINLVGYSIDLGNGLVGGAGAKAG
ncbi:Epidermal growth factor-like, type 3 [Akanthomyces lecanii RCEF 1005]|uniref:Epidermal growth factor-like, type 3 n=1 Tax=Akanthomyces lecanii RCEF 1005 TaxID=1081108 RepID=A0A168FLG4_CORDF|nr:Epidermal growth factor-like, type 3 [Akanthomyces lecanii RCEF 1005]